MGTTHAVQRATEYMVTLHTPGSGPPQQVDNTLFIYRAGADGWAKGPKTTADWLRVMPGEA